MDYQNILTVFHLLGVVLGMGGAFASDAIFFSSIRDERVSETEVRFLKLGGKLVWSGLFIIVISGAFLFLQDSEAYLASAKFLSKMTIVGILIANGLVFHLIHIPRFHRHAGYHFPSSDEFMRAVPFLLFGGVISTTSWLSAFILGMWRGIPYSYVEIMSVYGIIIVIGIAVTSVFKKRFIPHFR